MKNQYSRMENICPKEPKKLRIPDQLDLYMHTALAGGSWCGAERQRGGGSGSVLM